MQIAFDQSLGDSIIERRENSNIRKISTVTGRWFTIKISANEYYMNTLSTKINNFIVHAST